MSDWNKTIQEMFASPELDKAEAVDCYEQAVCDLAKATEEQRAEIARLSSELATSRERERALEREKEELAIEHSKQIADMASRFRAVNIQRVIEQTGQDIFAMADKLRATEAEVKRLREATIEECAIVADAFEDSEAVSALAAIAESKGVKSPGWIRDVMHSHAGELAGKIAAAIRALADE